MRILVTNDDGINAVGVKLLVEKAKAYGEVIVCCPKTEQSAKSHSIDIRNQLDFEEVFIFEGVKAYALDSTPADCVRFMYYGMKEKFDIIFSGCNRGFNVGFDILYSGTCAAIFEGALLGIKGIAFSSSYHSFSGFISHFDEVMKFIFEKNLLDYHSLYNVNFPTHPTDIIITRQGGNCFDTTFEIDNTKTIQGGSKIEENNDISLDTYARSNQLISITPLTHIRCDLNAYSKIKHIK